jgi:hypothetical protein
MSIAHDIDGAYSSMRWRVDAMGIWPTFLALGIVMLTTSPGLAADEPSRAQGVAVPAQPPASKSDRHRVVGRVLQIDRTGGLVKLATDEGVVVVPAPALTLTVIQVGETVSVPRAADESPSALPRQ